MKIRRTSFFHWMMASLVLSLVSSEAAPANPAGSDPAQSTPPIPWNELGAEATAQYSGDGLAVNATVDGARLRCDFQKLKGEVTPQGMRVSSTAPGSSDTPFRVLATTVGRECGERRTLPSIGTVETTGTLARFIRPGLAEEYSVSIDGLRQDFVLPERLPGDGNLCVELNVAGATAEASPDGVRLALERSGRKLDYHRLRATDATGRKLVARMERRSPAQLAVVVEDGAAVYPVRIDPTFSDANWIGLDVPGVTNGPLSQSSVNASVADGSGNLYVSGNFSWAGGGAAYAIAKWDGTRWSAVGSDFVSVRAMAVSGTDLYVGGDFVTVGSLVANYIAKWDGSSWSALGSGVDLPVRALAVLGSDLYAGGYFTTAGGARAAYIAKWDGANWAPVGDGVSNAVQALAVSGSDLYVGGSFAGAGAGLPVNYIAKWNGTAWSALGQGLSEGSPPGVFALAVSGADLYVGGQFRKATNSSGEVLTTDLVAKWNGSSWSALGSAINPPGQRSVSALAVSGGGLYVGGQFTMAGGVAANNLAKWNGSTWTPLGAGITGPILTLTASGGGLYVGGTFDLADGVHVSNIAKWNGTHWGTVGDGTNNFAPKCLAVRALLVSDGTLYAGTGPGPYGDAVAKWDGSRWTALDGWGGGPFASRYINTLAVFGGDLYAGGSFDGEDNFHEGFVAKWSGTSWLATEMDDTVNALAVSGGNLYAGGNFTIVGGVPASHIAKWNGSQWSALGSGTDGAVIALAAAGGDLYAGGAFSSAGGVPASNLARWDGSHWTALGSGLEREPGEVSRVNALAVSGSDLFAGGVFTRAGGLPAAHIAKWNGANWSALGQGMGGGDGFPFVYALTVSGSDLYAGGNFTGADGAPANYIAKWDGTGWSALGSGMNGGVYALAVSATGDELYAGGLFTTAGGKGAPHAARASLLSIPPPPELSIQLTAPNTVRISWPSPSTGFVLQQNPGGLSPAGWNNVTGTIQDDGTNRILLVNPTGPRGFYRLFHP